MSYLELMNYPIQTDGNYLLSRQLLFAYYLGAISWFANSQVVDLNESMSLILVCMNGMYCRQCVSFIPPPPQRTTCRSHKTESVPCRTSSRCISFPARRPWATRHGGRDVKQTINLICIPVAPLNTYGSYTAGRDASGTVRLIQKPSNSSIPQAERSRRYFA
jgi:hypothetical protein